MQVRPVTPQIRFLFWGVGCLLALLAAAQLLLWPEETDRLFAWTIARPTTAAFIGSCFLAVSVMAALFVRVQGWADVKLAFVGTLAFVTAMTAATLVHRDLFHLDSNEPVALVSALGWLVVYLAAPVTSAVFALLQLRRPGADPPPARSMLPALRVLLLVQAATLVAAAAWLYLVPGRADDLWPWPLTPLTARAVASFLLGFGVILGGTALEDAGDRLRAPLAGGAVLATLACLTPVRFTELQAATPQAVAYYVVFGSLLVSGVWGLLSAAPGAMKA